MNTDPSWNDVRDALIGQNYVGLRDSMAVANSSGALEPHVALSKRGGGGVVVSVRMVEAVMRTMCIRVRDQKLIYAADAEEQAP